MEMDNLQELLVEELSDLYSAENQLTKALPKMAKKATNPQLKKAFETHLRETEGQVKRLREGLREAGQEAHGQEVRGHGGADRGGQGDDGRGHGRRRRWTPP